MGKESQERREGGKRAAVGESSYPLYTLLRRACEGFKRKREIEKCLGNAHSIADHFGERKIDKGKYDYELQLLRWGPH